MTQAYRLTERAETDVEAITDFIAADNTIIAVLDSARGVVESRLRFLAEDVGQELDLVLDGILPLRDKGRSRA